MCSHAERNTMLPQTYAYEPHRFAINYLVRHPEIDTIQDKYSNTKRMKNPITYKVIARTNPTLFSDFAQIILATSTNDFLRVEYVPLTRNIIEITNINLTHAGIYGADTKWQCYAPKPEETEATAEKYENSLEYDIDRIMYLAKCAGYTRIAFPDNGSTITIFDDTLVYKSATEYDEDYTQNFVSITIDNETILVKLSKSADLDNAVKKVFDKHAENAHHDAATWMLETSEKMTT